MSTESAGGSRFGSFMKWLGIAAALLSFGTAIYKLIQSEAELRERGRLVSEQLAGGRAQEAAGDYAGAWDSFGKASAVAASDGTLAKLLGGLSAQRQSVLVAQEDLAMAWLRSAHAAEGHSFAEVTDKLVATLASGASGTTGARKADLLAHLGWAYFLKGRSGDTAVQPEGPYREAIAADGANPYANVFWGHWILWNHGSLIDADQKFNTALSTARARADVRHFQLAALANARSDNTDAQWLRVVSEMLKGKEVLDASTRNDLYQRYYFALNDAGLRARMLDAVPLTDQNELLASLLQADDLDAQRKAVLTAVMAKMAADDKSAGSSPGKSAARSQ